MVAAAIASLSGWVSTARAEDIGTMEVTASLVNPDGPMYRLESLSDQDELMLGQTLILKEGAIPIVAMRVISKAGRPVQIQARQLRVYDPNRPIRDGSQYTAVYTRRKVRVDEGPESERREPDLPEDWAARPRGYFEPLAGYMFGSYGSQSVSGLAGGLNLGVKKGNWSLGLGIRFGGLQPTDPTAGGGTFESGLASNLSLDLSYYWRRIHLTAGAVLVDRITGKVPVGGTSTGVTVVGNAPGLKFGLTWHLEDWLALNGEAFLHSYSVYNVDDDSTDYALGAKASSTRFILSVSFPFSRVYETETDVADF
jgi:hypothetical protein